MRAYVFPGQGSQHVGMGGELFDRFPDEVARADAILGYSLRTLCLKDPSGQLNRTEFTQPALYVVNALHGWDAQHASGGAPGVVAGHSLGEYNALLAAGMIDFETGLRLVIERGALMSRAAANGGMAAIVGLDAEGVAEVLRAGGFDRLDVANFNAPAQVVISGAKADIDAAQAAFEAAGARFVPLPVSAAFHSRFMRPASEQFAGFLASVAFSEPRVPVIANTTARPYAGASQAAALLAGQIAGSVRWVESVRYMMGLGVTDFVELGPKRVLTGLVNQIQPMGPISDPAPPPAPVVQPAPQVPPRLAVRSDPSPAERLGGAAFKAAHGLKYALVAGGLHHGVSSVEMVAQMARAGALGSLGTHGLEPAAIDAALARLRDELGNGEPFAVNIFANFTEPNGDQSLVEACLAHGVRTIEASGYVRISPALARYRLSGLRRVGGGIEARHQVIAKVSRPEIAEVFLQPVPPALVAELLARGHISPEQAELAPLAPAAGDICLEADSGWYSERAGGWPSFPAVAALRDRAAAFYAPMQRPRLGLAGGIGSPESAALAFFLGADFIVTGSINQCTVEAGLSGMAKDLLQACGLHDTVHAPGETLFEFGGQMQFLRRGSFFPARAGKLYLLYQSAASLDELDAKTRAQLEDKYFGKPLAQVWSDIAAWWSTRNPEEVRKAAESPRHRMLLVFRWYLRRATEAALQGEAADKVQFAVPCSAAMGGFNHWARGAGLGAWRDRRVAAINLRLLEAAAECLRARAEIFAGPLREAAE